MSSFKSYYTTATTLWSINTLYGTTDATFVPMHDTTINNKLGLNPNTLPGSNPKLRYMGIGIGGSYNVDDESGQRPYEPLAKDMDLYKPIPIRLLPIDGDLTESERAKYRMRTIKTIDGVDYIAYWLKVIDYPDNQIHVTQQVGDGITEAYTFDPADLNPIASKVVNSGVVEGTKIRAAVTGEATILGSEILEVINIMFNGDMTKAVISEIGFYSGDDKTVTGEDVNLGTFSYTDAVYVQLAEKTCSIGQPIHTADDVISRRIGFSNGSLYTV